MTTVFAGQTLNFSGTLAAGGTLEAEVGTTASPHGGLVNVAGSATNNGIFRFLAGPSQYSGYFAPSVFGSTLAVSGTLVNNSLIDLRGGDASYGFAQGIPGAQLLNTGVLTNTGLITIGAATPIRTYVSAYGKGAVLRDTGAMTNSGVVLVYGGKLGAGPTYGGGTLLVGGTLTNSGNIGLAGGTIVANAYTYSQSGGAGAQLQIVAGGALTNSGNITAAGGTGVYDFFDPSYGSSLGATIQVAGTLTNNGTIALAGGDDGYTYHGRGAALTIATSGRLTNGGQIVVNGGYGGGYRGQSGTGAVLTVAGVLTNNQGILIAAADIAYGAPGPTAGLLNDTGTITNNGSITLAGGPGYGSQYRGGTLAVSGTLSNFGRINVNGGAFTFVYGPASGYGAALNDSGFLTNSGTILVGGANGGYFFQGTGGTINITGTLTNQKLIEVQGGQVPPPSGKTGPFIPGGQIVDNKLLNNFGTIKLDGGMALHDHAGTLTIGGGATLVNSGTINGVGTLINNGTITSGTAITGNIAETGFLNNGLVKASPNSVLTVNSAVTTSISNKGTFDITANSRLTFNSSVAKPQTVAFLTGVGTLALGSPTTFAGIVAGLHPSSVIDFLHTSVTSAIATGTTLTLGVAGGGSLSLRLAAPLPSSDVLKLTSDGAGGTSLTITTAPAQFASHALHFVA